MFKKRDAKSFRRKGKETVDEDVEELNPAAKRAKVESGLQFSSKAFVIPVD